MGDPLPPLIVKGHTFALFNFGTLLLILFNFQKKRLPDPAGPNKPSKTSGAGAGPAPGSEGAGGQGGDRGRPHSGSASSGA